MWTACRTLPVFLWVVVYSVPPLDAFVAVWATLELHVCMDDIVISKQGSRETVLTLLT